MSGSSELVARAAARNIVVNGMGSVKLCQSVPTEAVEVVCAIMMFIPRSPSYGKIDSIKAVRMVDKTFGLKEAKDFVEEQPASGYFADMRDLNNYVRFMNDTLSGINNTGRVFIQSVTKETIHV